jgi:hypothetical protein
MSVILLALFPFAFVVGVLAATRAFAKSRLAAGPAEPTCGKCAYIVLGIEGWICPECGSDLREVGIIPPGGARRMNNGARLLVWTLIVFPPLLLLGSILSRAIGPRWASSQQQRVIFVQSPTLFTTIRAQLDGRKLVWGRPGNNSAVPYQTLTLTLNSGKPTDRMTVELATMTGTFTDAAGKRVGGRFDAGLIAAWLGANGFAGSADLDERSADVLTAVAEMTTASPRAGGFSYLSPDPAQGRGAMVTAHPAFKSGPVLENTAWTSLFPFAIAGTIWLIGPILIVRPRGTRDPRDPHRRRVESPRDANEA